MKPKTIFIHGYEYLDLLHSEFMIYLRPAQEKNKSVCLHGLTRTECIRPNYALIDVSLMEANAKIK